jgi:hypothetical protein
MPHRRIPTIKPSAAPGKFEVPRLGALRHRNDGMVVPCGAYSTLNFTGSAHRVVPAFGVVLHWRHPVGSAVDSGLDAIARVLRAKRVANGGVVYVQHDLHVSPRAPPITAQRGAQFYCYCTCNCIPPKKLRRGIQLDLNWEEKKACNVRTAWC